MKRLIEAISDPLAGRSDSRIASANKLRLRLGATALATLFLISGAFLIQRWQKSRGSSVTRPQSNATANSSTVPTPDAKPKTWVNPADEQRYVWIAPGTFTMGCSAGDSECKDNEKPAHPVDIVTGFWLGQTEVTIAAYQRFAAKHGIKPPGGDGTLPLTGLTWAQAKNYCSAIGGRLPTEAEWEFAARAGSSQVYYGMIPKIAWYADNSGDATHAVGSKQPNAFGLHDMFGNVKEWVLDHYYNKYYLDSAVTAAGVDQPLAPNATAVARWILGERPRIPSRLAQIRRGGGFCRRQQRISLRD